MTLLPTRSALIRSCLTILLAMLASGCESTRFYSQAAKGQWELITRKCSVEKLIDSPETEPRLKDRLLLTRDILRFAEEELRLPHCGSYQKYTQLDRPYVVWNVYAAPEFSVEDKEWWYPFVGSLSYRGYFSRESAVRYAERLEAKGFDVYVGGIAAYSTLGFFNDPLLSTFIHDHPAELAELIFHELAHSKKFKKSDTDFNEAFATAVAEEGARLWLKQRGDLTALRQYETAKARQKQFVELIIETKEQLETLFVVSPKDPDTPLARDLRKKKAEVILAMKGRYLELKASWDGYDGFDRWMSMEVNNAQINTVTTYYELAPALTTLIRDSGSFAEFYERVETISSLPEEQRHDPAKWPSHDEIRITPAG